MDYFLGSTAVGGPDSLSLQEMLDMDIKTENDYDTVFNCDDMTFNELPALNLDEDSLGAPGDNNVWMTSSVDSQLGGDTNSSLTQDFESGETRMVCPNSVMPVTLIQVPYDGNIVKSEIVAKPAISKLNNNLIKDTIQIKREVLEDGDFFLSDVEIKQEYESDDEAYDDVYSRPAVIKNEHIVRTKIRSNNANVKSLTAGTKKNNVTTIKNMNAKRRLHEYSSGDIDGMAYPKPAYSYSCLIAMALKNSPSGSLPVSEIYNFMCEHFPYFKTAPNGWKNSVRHNLSLNKCFEKIEKPVTNGSQRKGCLWAMNPNKINKMDEEVQKWSKKDKTAIRKSMVCPESLDALERGELSGGITISMSEVESDEEVWEQTSKQWISKQDTEGEEDEDDEDDSDEWTNDRLSTERILSALPSNDEELDGSDISLVDFDIADIDSLYNDQGRVNVRVNVQTSPHASFQPLMSGAYTVNSQSPGDSSSKRLKTLGGSTITGNYVYKPLGTSTIRRKSPLRHSLLSSLEADD